MNYDEGQVWLAFFLGIVLMFAISSIVAAFIGDSRGRAILKYGDCELLQDMEQSKVPLRCFK